MSLRPAPRLLVAMVAGLALAALPVAVDPALWVAWVGALGLLGLAAALDAAQALRRAPRVEIEPPAVAAIGSPAPLRLTFADPLAAASPLELTVCLDLDPDLAPVPLFRVRLAGAGAVESAIELVARRRGEHRVLAVWLAWRGPLGLVERIERRPVEVALRVVPDASAARAVALRMFGARDAQIGLKVEQYQGCGSEFESLREFVPGLDPRALDWKASARHWKLCVRSFRAERNHQVIVAFDTGHLLAEPLRGMPKLDHAVRAGLVLAYVGLKTGDRVGLYAFDERVRAFAAPEGGVRSFARFRARTAQLDYSSAETNFTLGLAALGERLRRRSLVVVFTDFVDTVTAELMVESLRRLARRHVIVFVALRDPQLVEAAGRRPESMDDVHRAVVAQGLVRDREVVLARLRHRAIHCLDATPGEVSAELVNRYLDIKRRELV